MIKFISSFTTFLFVTMCSAQQDWKSIDHKNGFHLQLPAYFIPGLLVAAGTLQYYENTLDSSIVITVETFGEGAEADLQQEYKEELKRNTITYCLFKSNWFVVSGTDDEGVFYLKTIISRGQIHRLHISYPLEKKRDIDKILGRIASSFH